MKKLITTILLILSIYCFGQNNFEDIPYANLKKMAKQYLHYNDSYTALEVYKSMHEIKPSDEEVMVQIALLSEEIRDYTVAIQFYEMLQKEDKDKYLKYGLNMAKCKMYLEEYEESLDLFKTFVKEYKGDDAVLLKKEIKLYETGMTEALKRKPMNMRVEPATSSINKPYTEFAPLMVGDTGLIYASMKATDVVSYELESPPDYMPRARFYKAEWKDEEWIVRGHLKGPFNDPGFDVGNGAFSLDGSRFYYTKCDGNDDGKFICQLYFSEFDTQSTEWSDPKLLPETINLPGYTCTQPTVGKDLKSLNEVLYFVSDRPEGQGGLDVWFSIYDVKLKTYEAPMNCGRNINSPMDEMTPFMEKASSTIYFSSNGGVGYGGFDIYKSQGQMGKFDKTQNLGTPANTGMDDLYYVVNEHQNAGFLVSNRDGAIALKHKNCCDDIFSFTYPDMLIFDVEGEITDSAGLPLKNAIVSLYLLGENAEEILVNRTKIRNDREYKFALLRDKDYKLQVYKEGYMNNSINVSTRGYTYSKTFERNIMLQEISFESVVIKNIYYEYNKSDLTDSSVAELNRVLLPILKENAHIIIEIGAHTDAIGSNAYNNKLSQQRAQSVVDFFVAQGIDKQRINAKGYGECCPIADNENEDGSDNPEGRALNRRTEFKIVGEVPGYTKLLYSE